MHIDMTRISGQRKNVWWMDAATGELTWIGTYPDGRRTFPATIIPHHDEAGIHDGVLVVTDASKKLSDRWTSGPEKGDTKDLTE